MTIGTIVYKAQLDQALGAFVTKGREFLAEAEDLGHYKDITLDATLVAMGYTSGEVATIKRALSDAVTWRNVGIGAAAVTPATNLFASLDQLGGMLEVT